MTPRLLAWAAVPLALVLCGNGRAADDKDEIQDIILMTDSRPVLLRFHVSVDGKPFRAVHKEAWEDSLARLFKYLDANGDGGLSEGEAARMPPPPDLAPSVTRPTNVAFNFRVVDDNGDGRITPAELAAFHRDYGVAPFQLHLAPRVAFVPDALKSALFEKLDADRDGKLSAAELEAAAAVLAKLDRDGDDLLTPQELPGGAAPTFFPPPPQPRQPARRQPAASPVLLVSGQEEPGSTAATVLSRFQKPDVELTVRLGKRDGAKALEIRSHSDKAADQAVSIRTSGEGLLVVKCEGQLFELRINDGGPTLTPGGDQPLLDRFRAADLSGKGKLNRTEAGLREFFPNVFSLLDRDRDGAITEAEIKEYHGGVQAPHARAIAASPALLVSDRGAGLFDLLDQDRDGRLSQRELRAAVKLPARLGRDPKEGLAQSDLTSGYRLAIGLGRASLGPDAATFAPRQLPTLALNWGDPTLVWFHKMDRNGDGDVSAREFLGTREVFRKIDVDGDGQIDSAEATRADALFRK